MKTPTLITPPSSPRYFSKGRQPGARNVISRTVKQNIIAVFEGLGSWEKMLEWAQSNKDMFYGSIYPKLLAQEGESKTGGPIRILVYAPQQSPTDKPVVLADSASMQLIEAAEQAEANDGVEQA